MPPQENPIAPPPAVPQVNKSLFLKNIFWVGLALFGVAIIGGGAYYAIKLNSSPQASSGNFVNLQPPSTPPLTHERSAIEVLSLSYPSLVYRINNIEDSNAWLRVVDSASGLSMWAKPGIMLGTHTVDLTSLPGSCCDDLGNEGPRISLSPGTYYLRLEVFVDGVGRTLAESGTFTVPGTVVAVPTCTIKMAPEASALISGTNTVTLTWSSKNAEEVYLAHSPPIGGNAIILGLTRGTKVAHDGSQQVSITFRDGLGQDEYWSLVVKNSRGATVCGPDGGSYFNSQKEIDNPQRTG